MKILLPSYFYPGPIWDALIESSSGQVIVILNPGNGPGETLDKNYLKLCTRLRKARIGILGYVRTDWGKRTITDTEHDVARWGVWYGVNDIFYDEASTSAVECSYYERLYRSTQGLVVLNPGTIPDEAYLECGDILVIFESTYAKHATAKFPHWIKRHPKKRFCQMIHTCPEKQLKRALAKVSETSEFVYVTDDTETDDNPYDALPTYWQKELKACK